MVDNINNEYSWNLQEWWNTQGSYSRVQYLSSEILDTNSFINIINEWINLISSTGNTRLDIRSIISNDFDIWVLKQDFPDWDIATKKFKNIIK